MWTTLPLTAALALVPAQPPAAGELTLTNVRRVYGELGGTRPDAPVLPGDVVTLAFDIEGITISDDGKATYTMSMETLDKSGMRWFKQDPAQLKDTVPLGGRRIPARAFVAVGFQQPAGEYVMRVSVVDDVSKARKVIDHKYTVLPPGFGIVAVNTSYDDRGGLSAPTSGVVGQAIFVHAGVVGFQRDPKTKQPRVVAEMTITDEAGKPTLPKPAVIALDSGVDEKEPTFIVRFFLPMTRPGKFTVNLKVTDTVANKSATYTLPVAVTPPAN
jgi:hypothetical protein